MRLFDTPTAETTTPYSAGTISMGKSSELLLASRLLELGHPVAVPLADDDGVDLIVNYRTLIQIKSSSCRLSDGSLCIRLRKRTKDGRVHNVPDHVDVLAIYARDSRTWWFLPGDVARSSTSVNLREYSTASKYDAYREAWYVFDTGVGYEG